MVFVLRVRQPEQQPASKRPACEHDAGELRLVLPLMLLLLSPYEKREDSARMS